MLANYPWLMWGIILGWTGLSIWLSNKTKLGRKLGYINLCIIGGFVLVNIKVVPQFCEQYSILSNYFIPLAIVLMLFQANLKKLWKIGKKLIAVFGISLVIVFAICVLAGIIFQYEGGWKLWGAVTANMIGNFSTLSGVAAALGLQDGDLVVFSATGMIIWMVYSLIAFDIGKSKFFKKNFKSYRDEVTDMALSEEERLAYAEEMASKEKKVGIIDVAVVMGAGMAVAALGNFLGELTGFYSIVFYAGIAVVIANFTKIGKFKISEDLASFMFGMYIFSLGANATLASIANSTWKVTVGVIFIYAVSFLLVFLVLKLIRMPWEYGLISHMALIGGPVTIGPLCDNYGLKDMVLPGCILAVLGQVLGAYLGLGAANIILSITG